MSGSANRSTPVFLDTNAIIESQRIGAWRALAGGYSVETVEDCVTETQTGVRMRRSEQLIVASHLLASLAGVHTAGSRERAELAIRSQTWVFGNGSFLSKRCLKESVVCRKPLSGNTTRRRGSRESVFEASGRGLTSGGTEPQRSKVQADWARFAESDSGPDAAVCGLRRSGIGIPACYRRTPFTEDLPNAFRRFDAPEVEKLKKTERFRAATLAPGAH